MHILSIRYLEKEALCFNKVTRDSEAMNKNSKKAGTVSNLEEKIKKTALHKKKRDIQALSLTAACPFAFAVPLHKLSAPPFASASVVFLLIPGSAFLSASISRVFVPMPGLTALPSVLSRFDVSVPMPGFSALPSVLSMSSLTLPMPRSSALPSVSSVSGVFMLVPGLLTPPSVMSLFDVSMLVLGLSASPESSFLFFFI